MTSVNCRDAWHTAFEKCYDDLIGPYLSVASTPEYDFLLEECKRHANLAQEKCKRDKYQIGRTDTQKR